MLKVNKKLELGQIDGLVDIEVEQFNILLSSLVEQNRDICYEIIDDPDAPIQFRDIGIEFRLNGKFLAEVYCGENVSGLTGEYQVSSATNSGDPKYLQLPEAVMEIIEQSKT